MHRYVIVILFEKRQFSYLDIVGTVFLFIYFFMKVCSPRDNAGFFFNTTFVIESFRCFLRYRVTQRK